MINGRNLDENGIPIMKGAELKIHDDIIDPVLEELNQDDSMTTNNADLPDNLYFEDESEEDNALDRMDKLNDEIQEKISDYSDKSEKIEQENIQETEKTVNSELLNDQFSAANDVISDDLDESEENAVLSDANELIEKNENLPLFSSLDRAIERRTTIIEIIRTFNKKEIQEVNAYIAANVPYSVLTQLFILTEKPIHKAQIFVAVYRLIQSAERYVASENTRYKLNKLLSDGEREHEIVYEQLSKFQHSNVNFNRHHFLNKIEDVFIDQKANQRINRIIDAFLVFAEKQELLDVDKVTGLDLENEQGQKALKSIITDTPME